MMEIARLGISLVPEERRIFTNLTVAENLRLAQVTAKRAGWTLEHVYEKFPRLRERLAHRGDEISGGEKQMLAIARAGVALVPEDRRIFTNLTVAENLKLAQVTARRPGWTLDHVYEKFPRLRERLTHRGDEISGGEKQMLAIARALVQDVKVLLLDEPTEGLAPLIVREVENVIREIKAAGITTLLVEQNLYSALSVADRCYIIDQGEIRFEGTPEQIREDEDLRKRYLHV
ncbi:MAG: ATP-binding cassette domain-containing protein [Candidatus Eremiobacteraeota bacterium]|nr:ATP-binding cassette domain-containing protein [Candidatus Eremiobacteraeota bacterium]